MDRLNPTATAMGIAIVVLRLQRNSMTPTRNRTRASWRRRGRAVKICGKYHRSRDSTLRWWRENAI